MASDCTNEANANVVIQAGVKGRSVKSYIAVVAVAICLLMASLHVPAMLLNASDMLVARGLRSDEQSGRDGEADRASNTHGDSHVQESSLDKHDSKIKADADHDKLDEESSQASTIRTEAYHDKLDEDPIKTKESSTGKHNAEIKASENVSTPEESSTGQRDMKTKADHAPSKALHENQAETDHSWSLLTWCVGALFVICCVMPCCGVVAVVAQGASPIQCSAAIRGGILMWRSFSKTDYNMINLEDGMREVLGSLACFQTWINFVGFLFGFIAVLMSTPKDSTSAPIWILTGILPLVLVGAMVERRLMRVFGGPFRLCKDSKPLLESQIERSDNYSDGCSLAVMLINDKLIHAKFVHTFQMSTLGPIRAMAPLADLLHLWGLAAFCMVLSQSLTFLLAYQALGGATESVNELVPFTSEELEAGSIDIEPDSWYISAADAAGFKVISARLDTVVKDRAEAEASKAVAGFATGLMENATQCTFNVTLLMLLGVQTLTAQPVSLLSSLLSLTSLLKKAFGMFSSAKVFMDDDDKDETLKYGFSFFVVICGLLLLIIAAWNLMRLWFIEMCPHHAWQITSGCISL